MRTFDKDLIWKRMQEYRQEFEGFELNSWVDNPLNIALTDGEENVAMFELASAGVYSGHYFFHSGTRGKKAIETARTFLDEVFANEGTDAITGLTPVDHKGARWISRQLGFKSYGFTDTSVGPCEIFILTRNEREADN